MIKKTTTLIDTDTQISLKELPTGNLEIMNGRPTRIGQDYSFNFSNSKPETILKVCRSIISLVENVEPVKETIKDYRDIEAESYCTCPMTTTGYILRKGCKNCQK
jgi:hypothetical protein